MAALEIHSKTGGDCYGCPYRNEPFCHHKLCEDAIKLVEAQKPHVMTSNDFKNNPNVDNEGYLPAWVEYRRTDGWDEYWEDQSDEWASIRAETTEPHESRRYWTGKPTQAQMEETLWN